MDEKALGRLRKKEVSRDRMSQSQLENYTAAEGGITGMTQQLMYHNVKL